MKKKCPAAAVAIILSLLLFTCAKKTESTSAEIPAAAPPTVIAAEPEYSDLQAPDGLSRTQSAEFFDSEGMKLLDKEENAPAAALFRSAILENSMLLTPHYHLTHALARLLEKQSTPEREEELYDELAICLGLDATALGREKDWMVGKLKTDADFSIVRASKRFQDLLLKGIPKDRSWESLLAGDWGLAKYNVKLELVEEDSSYHYSVVYPPYANQTADGAWQLNEDKSILFTGTALFTLRIDQQDFSHYDQVRYVEFDPAGFTLSLYTDREDSIFVLNKITSPLHEAMAGNDWALAARLLSIGIRPSYRAGNQGGQTAFEMAVTQNRGALVRLFLGKEGITFGPFSVPRTSAYFALFERAQKRTGGEKLEQGAQ